MKTPVPEFSRIINAARIPATGIEELVEAKPAERAALAKRFDLLELPQLKAHLMLTPGSKQTVVATGEIEADVVQRCVATLEPLANHIHVNVTVSFIPKEQGVDKAGLVLDELEEEFDYFSGGKIDIGEMVAQQLGVNIDLYPRKPDAAPIIAEFGAKGGQTHPFAKLSEVIKINKNKDKEKD